MTEAKLERLILLNEECAEIQQAISKIIRYGEDSFNPFDKDKITNKESLEKELGHLVNAIEILTNAKDMDGKLIEEHYNKKKQSIQQWLHHNIIS